MKTTQKLYRILEIINGKAARKRLKAQLCEKLDIHLQTLYRKMNASADSRVPFRFNDEEEKIIADTLNVELSQLFVNSKEKEQHEKSANRIHAETATVSG